MRTPLRAPYSARRDSCPLSRRGETSSRSMPGAMCTASGRCSGFSSLDRRGSSRDWRRRFGLCERSGGRRWPRSPAIGTPRLRPWPPTSPVISTPSQSDAYEEPLLEKGRRIIAKYQTPILLVLAYLAMRILFLVTRGCEGRNGGMAEWREWRTRRTGRRFKGLGSDG